MQKLIYSALDETAGLERLEQCFQKQREAEKPIYYLLPSNKWLQAARKRRSGIAFKTFDDLADLILKKANIDYFPVSESERVLFFQELMANKEEKFTNPKELRHKAKAFATTYGQLKRLGLSIGDLPEHFQQMESIFKEYEREWVKQKRLLDPENRIHEAISIQDCQQLNLAGIVIDGYLDFSTLQYMVIDYFVSQGIEITIYLPTFEGAEIVNETIEQLKRLGFAVEKAVSNSSTKIASTVTVKSATTVEEEIHGVVEEIINSELSYKEVGIVLADDIEYGDRLIKVANEKKLPIQLAKKAQIKDTLIVQFIYQSLLKHNGRFVNRWDSLDLVDTFLRLQFSNSLDYMNHKKLFIETGFLKETIQRKIEDLIKFRKQVSKSESLVSFLKGVRDALKAIDLPTIWRERLLIETNTEKLKQIRLEWKAYEAVLELTSTMVEQLENQGLDDLTVHYQIFVEWFYERIQNTTIYVERSPKEGVYLYSFRDVALFRGEKLYVLGMNEGKFPTTHKLGGYFQETDIKKLPIPFAAPSRKLFRKKDDALFSQLFCLTERISFSYVVGVDPHNPLLPSVYLEQWKDQIQDRQYSSKNRYSSPTSHSSVDYEQKLAYHLGAGKEVQEVPKKLANMLEKIEQLETGTEKVSSQWQEKLKREKLSVTMLESYAACPFKFALERILNIQEPLERRTIIDFRDVGSMLHTIIEKLYKQLDLIGKPFSMFTKEMKKIAEKTLFEIFEEEWAGVEAKHSDFSKLQLSIEKEEWTKKLRKWWLAELKHFWENKQLQSMHLFRLEETVELDLKLDENTTITLSGKIDRIDIDEHGFVIYDYKSGFASLNFQKEVRPGLKLQLPLYLVALETRMANGHYEIDLTEKFGQSPMNVTAHGASYISLKDPVKRAGNSVWRQEHFGSASPFGVHAKATKEETLEAEVFLAKYEIKARLKELWKGSSEDFSVKPLNCFSSCTYKSVCRVTPEQIEEGEEEWK